MDRDPEGLALDSFDHRALTRLVMGRGALERLGPLVRELGARRVLVVSDPGVKAVGHVGRAIASLERSGLEAALFDGVEENPTALHVEAGLEAARTAAPEAIVGLGGGSAMDCAKGINFLYSCGGRIENYRGTGKATRDLLPMAGVPTTAGTGSEMQSFALIADPETHQKMACGDPRAAFRVALLDPEVTVTQPRAVTAAAGLDALAHAVETAVTRRRSWFSEALSREAWRLLAESYLRVLEEPENLEARGRMQLGAALAGWAIEESMLGAAHAAANPLTARYGVVHGAAVGVMLPPVVRFNAPVAAAQYAGLAALAGAGGATPSPEALARRLEEFLGASGLPVRLGGWGVERERLGELAREAERQWTARFNPRPLGAREFLRLYEAAWE